MENDKKKQVSFTEWLKLHPIVGKRPDVPNSRRDVIACADCGKYKFLYHVPGDDEYFSSYCYSCMKEIYKVLVENGNLESYVEQMR